VCDVSLSRGVFILAVRAPIDTREEAEDFINVDLASRGDRRTFLKTTTKSRILG
jgi:hypothetical protein